MSELMLETSEWDLIPDQNGDIAVCSDPYATAQQVANECRLYQGEAYYAPDQGIPLDPDVFGETATLSYVGMLMQEAALTVDGVVTATPSLYRKNREVRGAVLVSTSAGIDLTIGV